MLAKFLPVIVGFLYCANSFGATYDFSYSGRLVDSNGRPLDGPVALKASFFHSETGANSILDVTSGLTQVPLSEGVFQIKLSLSDSDFQRVFPGVNQSVYIQITDLTHSPNQPYDRQQLTILPYAGKIPIDTSQFSWDSLGQLRFTASTTADFTSAGPIGTTTPNTAIFTTVTTNRTSSVTSGSVVNVTISPTYNQASGTAANTDLLINRTETAVGSGTQRLIDAQVGGTTRFNVSNTGNGYFAGNVGIGTTSPSQKLEVSGNVNVTANTPTLYLNNDGGASNDNPVIKWDSSSNALGLSFVSGSTQVARMQDNGALYATSLGTIGGTNIGDFFIRRGTSQGMSFPNAAGISFGKGSLSSEVYSTEWLRILDNGNVGIGTTNPSRRLHIKTAGGTGVEGVILEHGAEGSVWSYGIMGSANSNPGSFTFEDDGLTKLLISPAGNVGIGTTSPSQKLAVGASGDGSAAIANSWTTYSDKRLKKNVSVIDSALEKISKLSGYFFQWKKGSDKSRQIGVMAQEVEKIFPELVKQGTDGIKSVDYPKLAVPMLEAIKSLKGQVEQLKGENSMLKTYLCDKDPNAKFCEGSNE